MDRAAFGCEPRFLACCFAASVKIELFLYTGHFYTRSPFREGNMRYQQEYQRRLSKALQYIQQHLSKTLTLAEIAAEACFSPYHFHRQFVATTGETVAGYQRRLRLERAVELLIDEPSRPIVEVARQLGFSSAQNFARAFRQSYGLSPRQIRHCPTKVLAKTRLEASCAHPCLIGPFIPGQPLSAPDLPRSDMMQVQIVERPAQRVAYLRLTGPYPEVMPDGFRRLGAWSAERQLCGGDWLALYWDDPMVTPAAELTSDVAVSVPADTDVEGDIQLQTIPAGQYACYRCQVSHGDFATPWNQLYREWLPQSGFQPAEGPCFEQYLNDGTESGIWELNLFTPIKPL